MKTNDNKSVKPQHLAAVALATAVTLPGMAILAEEVDQKLIEQDVIQQTENSEFVGITDTIFYEEENIGEEVPDTNQFNESQEKESDEEKLFLGESEEFTTENQENENLKDSAKATESETKDELIKIDEDISTAEEKKQSNGVVGNKSEILKEDIISEFEINLSDTEIYTNKMFEYNFDDTNRFRDYSIEDGYGDVNMRNLTFTNQDGEMLIFQEENFYVYTKNNNGCYKSRLSPLGMRFISCEDFPDKKNYIIELKNPIFSVLGYNGGYWIEHKTLGDIWTADIYGGISEEKMELNLRLNNGVVVSHIVVDLNEDFKKQMLKALEKGEENKPDIPTQIYDSFYHENDLDFIEQTYIATSPESLKEELSRIVVFNDNESMLDIFLGEWNVTNVAQGIAKNILSVKALKGGETSFGLKLGDKIISEVNCKVIPKFTLSESKVSLDQDKKEVTLTAESEFISDELANEILDKLKWENNSSAKVDIKKEFKDGKFAITFTLYPSMEVYKDESSSLVIKNLNMKDITLEIFQKGHFEYKELYQILNSPGFKNSMIQYLTKDGNFTASLLVSEKDPKFGTALVKAYSDLYFRGLDGWKEIIASEASKDLATDILIGYIYNSSDIISQMSAEKEGFSLVKKLSEALKWYLAKEMNEHLEDAGILNQLNKEITSLQDSSEFSKALISGKIDDVLDILVKNGSNISAKKISDFFNRFYKSSEYVNKASEYLKKFGYAVDGIMVTKDTMNNFSKFNALANANKYYIEMLDYIEKNCELKAMVNASKEVKALIYREFSSLEYVLRDAIQKGTDIAINEALKFAGTKVPILNIIKTGFDLGKFAGNALFNVSSMQESYDKLRCYTYLNKALSSWTISKNTKFAESLISQNNVDADNAAYEYLYTLDILAEGRIGGEKTLQKYLDYIWMNKNEELIRLSKTIQEGIESQNKYWDLGKLMEKCVTVNISCPVDIQVFDKNGGYLFTIKDGKEMAEQLDGLRYNVEYDQLVDDYNKILTFNPETGYSLKLVGYSTGCVDYLVMYKDENGLSRYKTINNIPIEKGTEISIKHIDENAKLILSENDLKKMVYEPVLRESQKYQKVDSIDLKVKNRVMAPGESQPIYTVLNPSDSTISDVYWSTSNSDIIRISDDGILTAIKSGTATICAYTVDGAKKRVIITVSNLNEIGDKTDDPINDKNPSEKPTPPINDPNKKPDTNDPGDTNKPDEKPSNNTPVIKPMVNKGNETKVIPVKAESTIEKVNGSSIKHSPETGIAIQKSSSIWMNILSLLGLGWIVHKKRNH